MSKIAFQNITTFTAKDAKTRFGEVLDRSLSEPVGITRHDRLTAFMLSKRDYDSLVSKVQDLEDQLLLAQAESARKEGFVSQDRVQAFLSGNLELTNHEEVGN